MAIPIEGEIVRKIQEIFFEEAMKPEVYQTLYEGVSNTLLGKRDEGEIHEWEIIGIYPSEDTPTRMVVEYEYLPKDESVWRSIKMEIGTVGTTLKKEEEK